MRRLLILTATVSPPATPYLVRRDVTAREDDYVRALRFYSEHIGPDDMLWLVENSGWDCTGMLRRSGCDRSLRVLVQSCAVDPTASLRGKGNGEALILRSVAELLTDLDEPPREVVKITGRLLVRNLSRCLRGIPGSPFFRCRLSGNLQQVDTRFFACDYGTWQSHLGRLEPLVHEEAGRYLEHAVASRLSEAVFNGVIREPFPVAPIIAGVSGSTGGVYGGPRAWLHGKMESRLAHLVVRGYF